MTKQIRCGNWQDCAGRFHMWQ